MVHLVEEIMNGSERENKYVRKKERKL